MACWQGHGAASKMMLSAKAAASARSDEVRTVQWNARRV